MFPRHSSEIESLCLVSRLFVGLFGGNSNLPGAVGVKRGFTDPLSEILCGGLKRILKPF